MIGDADRGLIESIFIISSIEIASTVCGNGLLLRIEVRGS